FVFLPALVGWSAAKRFGGSEILGIVLGLLLVHPDLLNAWNYGKAAAGLDGASVPYFDLFGLRIEKVGYQGQILPILAAAWVMCRVELWLKPRVPNAVQLLVVPIVTIAVSGFLALAVIGPLARHLGIAVTDALVYVFNLAPWLGAALFGALYAPLVLTGMHHMFIAVDLQLISSQGGTFIWPMIALSNIAQGSAALAMFWLARNANDKNMASTSAVSAFFGITEPAMFGVNLRYKLPFYAALAGSACAAVKVNGDALRQVALVKGHFINAGVFQIVIGAGDVDRVYAEMVKQGGVARATIADVKASGDAKQNRLQQLVKVFSDVFMPILPAIVIAGLLMGANNLLGAKGMFIADKSLLDAYPGLSGLWGLINMMANTSFVFLPALVGWSAAKRFGGSEILGIVL
ncbi:PTS transporter subunit EIIC, partial (plasmid) [Chromobacterium amazonense]|uniref:PTS transporter subunit EIIC n=1 Tax=Chromobacterium amazonense TaxID=1382803 RepID=UPI00237ECE58